MTTYGSGGWGTSIPWGSVGFPSPTLPVSTANAVQKLGVIEATLGAIGEEDNAIGGFVMTRLTSVVTAGTTTLPVESTLYWPSSGKIALGGISYDYTGITATSFTGLSHIAAGTTVVGAAIDHTVDSAVIDISKQRSALETLRRALLVAYAEEEDLNVIGRNLSVMRQPLFGDDDQYRLVIQNMAYNPKGTIFGLELALDALIGVGMYTIYEDLIMYPCTVFVYIDSSMGTTNGSAGKSYLSGPVWDALSGSSDTLTMAAEPFSVQGVTLKDLGEVFDFRNDKPSAVTYAYYPGATPSNAFTYSGGIAEGTGVIQVAGSYTKFQAAAPGTVYYTMTDAQGARVTPDSYVEVDTILTIPTGSVLTAGKLLQVSASIYDGAYMVHVGMDDSRNVGLFATEGGGFLGSTTQLTVDQFYTISLRKFEDDYVELWVDGQFIDRQLYSAFTGVTAAHSILFGLRGTPGAGTEAWYKQACFQILNNVDYWSAHESGTATVNVANPTRLVLAASGHTFIAGDVGKQLILSGSGTSNPTGGNNNGDWIIDSFVSGTTVELTGKDEIDATVSSVNPTRITVAKDRAFKYPDDLGKTITISGSALGNDGTYTITALLQEGTFTDFSTWDTPMEEWTTICEASSATFVSESELDWKLDPVFVTETGLDWVQADASSFVTTTLTLRLALWANNLIMEISYSDVLTAQILPDTDARNEVIQESPLKFEYYPFYITDAIGPLTAYLDTITLAGVIPEVLVEE